MARRMTFMRMGCSTTPQICPLLYCQIISTEYVLLWSKKQRKCFILAKHLNFEKSENNQVKNNDFCAGKSFVITGKLAHFTRDGIKEFIEQHGGKVIGSVSSKCNYLINNDIHSTSSKNRKAKELNIPIMNEQDFLKNF